MAKYAIILDGLVVNMAESDSALEANWVEAGDAQIGWSYDGEAFTAPPPDNSDAAITAERERRIAGNFTFNGVAYDFDAESKSRITGMATLAGFSVSNGTEWPTDFAWIAADNSFVPMDAVTCFSFGQAAATHEAGHIFAARAIKDAIPRPIDVTDDALWP
jgi:hypothetical protein